MCCNIVTRVVFHFLHTIPQIINEINYTLIDVDEFAKQIRDEDACKNEIPEYSTTKTNNVCLNTSIYCNSITIYSVYCNSITTSSPSPNATLQPSADPSILPTIYPSTTSVSSHDQTRFVHSLKQAIDIASIALMILAICVIILAYVFKRYKKSKKKVTMDDVKYMAILVFFSAIGEMFSQLVFGMILVIENEIFLYDIGVGVLILIFFGIHVICTFVLLMRFFSKLKKSTRPGCDLMQDYIEKYIKVIVFCITVSGLYPCIGILTSGLFNMGVFDMPIQLSDKQSLIKYKCAHILLTDSIPQLFLQMIYYLNKEHVEVMAIFTTIWSVVSMIVLMIESCYYYKNNISPVKSVEMPTSSTVKGFQVEVSDPDVKPIHTCCKNAIKDTLTSYSRSYRAPAHLPPSKMQADIDIFGSSKSHEKVKFFGVMNVKHDADDKSIGHFIEDLESTPQEIANVKCFCDIEC